MLEHLSFDQRVELGEIRSVLPAAMTGQNLPEAQTLESDSAKISRKSSGRCVARFSIDYYRDFGLDGAIVMGL